MESFENNYGFLDLKLYDYMSKEEQWDQLRVRYFFLHGKALIKKTTNVDDKFKEINFILQKFKEEGFTDEIIRKSIIQNKKHQKEAAEFLLILSHFGGIEKLPLLKEIIGVPKNKEEYLFFVKSGIKEKALEYYNNQYKKIPNPLNLIIKRDFSYKIKNVFNYNKNQFGNNNLEFAPFNHEEFFYYFNNFNVEAMKKLINDKKNFIDCFFEENNKYFKKNKQYISENLEYYNKWFIKFIMTKAPEKVKDLMAERFLGFWSKYEKNKNLIPESEEKDEGLVCFIKKTKEELIPWIEKMKIKEIVENESFDKKNIIKKSQFRF